jgi:hypothetical protein
MSEGYHRRIEGGIWQGDRILIAPPPPISGLCDMLLEINESPRSYAYGVLPGCIHRQHFKDLQDQGNRMINFLQSPQEMTLPRHHKLL